MYYISHSQICHKISLKVSIELLHGFLVGRLVYKIHLNKVAFEVDPMKCFNKFKERIDIDRKLDHAPLMHSLLNSVVSKRVQNFS